MLSRTPYQLELQRRREPAPAAPVVRPAGAPAMVGRVTTASPAVGKFLLVHPVTVTGTESEGGAGSLSVNTGASVPVLLLGPGVPAAGDDLVCRFVDYRWVAERKGSGCTATFSGQVLDCLSHGLAGATVTVKDHTTHALLTTLTADGSGNFSGSVPVSGTTRQVDLQATYGGQTSSSVLRTYSCGTNSAQVLSIVAKPVTFTPTGCTGANVEGVAISVTDGTNTYTCTTANPGAVPPNACKITLPPGSYTVTGTHPRFTSGSTTFTVTSSCSPPSQTVSFSMGAAASGYACLCGLNVPVATTLHATGMGGTFTMTYNAATGGWNDSTHSGVTFPGGETNPCCSGSAVAVDAYLTECRIFLGNAFLSFRYLASGLCPNAGSTSYGEILCTVDSVSEAPALSVVYNANTQTGTNGGGTCTLNTGTFTVTE